MIRASVIWLAVAGVAQADQAGLDNLRAAMLECAAFVEAQSLERFEEVTYEAGSQTLYELKEARTEQGLVLEFTHFIDSDAGVPLWKCKVSSVRWAQPMWFAAGVDALFDAPADLREGLRPVAVEDGRWRYQDCANPEAPVEWTMRLSDKGAMSVSVETPVLDALFCGGKVDIKDVLYACVYTFAQAPWEAIRAENDGRVPGQWTSHHQKTIDEIVEMTGEGATARAGQVATDWGDVDVRVEDGRCLTAGNRPYAEIEPVVFDWMISAVTFYDGVMFNFDGGRGLYTCADSFPNVAMFLSEWRGSFALEMTTAPVPGLEGVCA